MIPIYKPYLPKKSLKHVKEAINSTWISSIGKYIELCENKISELLNIKNTILVNNGTSATHLVAIALNIYNSRIKKLIVPSNVYVAAWNMFKVNPIYDLIPVDSDINTWNYNQVLLDEAIEKNPDAALLLVHNIGNIININRIKTKYKNLIIVEDNCEGFLGKYDNLYSGTNSLASSISFFGNKTITSGEGGAFLTNNDDIYNRIKSIKNQGSGDKRYTFNELGYNYRMTNIEAALLYGQLEILNEIIELKENVFRLYNLYLSSNPNIMFQVHELNTKHSKWFYSIRIPDKKIFKNICENLSKNNIEWRPMFPSINTHKHLATNLIFPISDKLYESVILLPSYPELSKNEIIKISNIINKS